MTNLFEWIRDQASRRRKAKGLPEEERAQACPFCQGQGTYVKDSVMEICACEPLHIQRSDVIYIIGADGRAYPQRRKP